MTESADDVFRWQAFFQHAVQPMFLLNRRRRILFVNRAWETCTGLKLADVRGRACRRRSASATLDKDEAILSACTPPVDAMEGRPAQVRRRAPGGPHWWEIHYLPFPGEKDLLGILGTIRVLAGHAEAPPAVPEKLMALRDRQATRYRLDDCGVASAVLQRIHEQARLAARTPVPITLQGEAGVGKQWLARAIHGASDQSQRYFACLDCEKLPAPILGDLLLGPRRQLIAFGTIYLCNADHLPREWQSRLTEAINLGESGGMPRLIVGFRHDPGQEIQAGRLLEEFFCAVSAITIALPPLRDRLSEFPSFCEIFLQRTCELAPDRGREIGPEAMSTLRSYGWPGNLHELLDVLRDASRRAKATRIELADLPFFVKQGGLPTERRLPLDTLLEQVERRLIVLCLKLTQNNQTRAAELLEIWRPRLMRRMEKFGLKNGE